MNKILVLFLMSAFTLNASENIDTKNIYSIYGSCEIPFYNDLGDSATINGIEIKSKEKLSFMLIHDKKISIRTTHHLPRGISYHLASYVTPLVWNSKQLGTTSEIEIEHLKYNGEIKISSLIGKKKGIYRFDNNGGVDFDIPEAV